LGRKTCIITQYHQWQAIKIGAIQMLVQYSSHYWQITVLYFFGTSTANTPGNYHFAHINGRANQSHQQFTPYSLFISPATATATLLPN